MIKTNLRPKKDLKASIAGNPHEGTTLLRPIELKMINFLAPRLPSFLKTHHLTLSSLFFSALMIVASLLARNSLGWFWLVTIALVFQYFADILDGEIGRRRKTGLTKWRFYTDHFLDFVFSCSFFIAHSIVWPADFLVFLLLLAVSGGFFVHEALGCICLGKYNIRGYHLIGGTEVRLLVILVDSYILLFRPGNVGIIFLILLPFSLFVLASKVYERQKGLWRADIQAKGVQRNKPRR